MCEALNQAAPNWITLNRTMQSQTKACITKSSCKICTLLGIWGARSGNFLIFKGQDIQKRTEHDWSSLTVFFFGILSII